MDRRKSLKSLFLGTVAGGLALHGCKPEAEVAQEESAIQGYSYNYGRTPKEKELIMELEEEVFFNEHEMETIAVLCALILPANDKFGSATDAGTPAFIEFMAKDIPEMQATLRGGLMWLDHKSNTEYNLEFKSAEEAQQKQLLDAIAFYDPEVPMNEQPLEIQFFSMMRNLTLTGYYTSKMGIEDLGYQGNMPNVWDGVPEDVLEQHGVAYDEEWIAKCVDQSKRGVIAEWDENGNLLT
ncbi:gluconate 2-dehydrogenase subunit 3 family protein [Zeaxanthinibacter enoshimensis]|uniref:Gluconate 2-dehydrogenase subunit 3-like protein n=1 Tax=Zeaxanthinibacter enoshimensis TaxID=392009 RepID=A0A4R6TJU8_9FLAO|nr:gluconate 2-dehydrogenase subunit 3 family protein [Zeaxanthinibacter enoshimensis]TDQ31126.1 gluconate 2-dehydrogenase subunit 3-like protein [Zeaxanthinibacter enoshimensis]